MVSKTQTKKLKILYIDIETLPNIGVFWTSGYKLNIGPECIIQERTILSIQWKWEGEKKVNVDQVNLKDFNDKPLLKRFMPILSQADLVVAQNGDKFDMRFIRGRLMYHHLTPMASVQTADTLKMARNAFYLNSYKLDYMSKFIGSKGKIKTDLSLWMDILLHKSQKALNKMLKYGAHDIILLEKLYKRIRPYVQSSSQVHHGRVLGHDHMRSCPSCGSEHVHKDGQRLAFNLVYKRYRCTQCKHSFRGERI